VVGSVILHGLTDGPGAEWIAARGAENRQSEGRETLELSGGDAQSAKARP
jgi:hypothetical protein